MFHQIGYKVPLRRTQSARCEIAAQASRISRGLAGRGMGAFARHPSRGRTEAADGQRAGRLPPPPMPPKAQDGSIGPWRSGLKSPPILAAVCKDARPASLPSQ